MSRKPLDTGVAVFVDAVGLLIRRVRAAAATHDLSWSEAAVLGRLRRHGPATTADLARAEAVRPQSMGATVAALEIRDTRRAQRVLGLSGRASHAVFAAALIFYNVQLATEAD